MAAEPALRVRYAADLDRGRDGLLDGGVLVELAAHELGEREGELDALHRNALGIFLHDDLQLLLDLQQLGAQLRRELRREAHALRSLATDSISSAFGRILLRSASARI